MEQHINLALPEPPKLSSNSKLAGKVHFENTASKRPTNGHSAPLKSRSSIIRSYHTAKSQIQRANILSLLHLFFAVKLIRLARSLKDRTLTIADLGPVGP